MSKGGGATRTVTSQTGAPEYAQPFLEFGLSEAKELYGRPQQFFPGSTTVGFAPETEMALSGLRQQAVSGSPFIGAVQDVVMQNLTGTNPLMAAAFRPAIEAVQAEASKAGRYGSGYQQAALAQALAPMAYQAQQQAIAQAPALASSVRLTFRRWRRLALPERRRIRQSLRRTFSASSSSRRHRALPLRITWQPLQAARSAVRRSSRFIGSLLFLRLAALWAALSLRGWFPV